MFLITSHSGGEAVGILLSKQRQCAVRFTLFELCPPGLLCDLLWSDPDKDVQGWGENDRGVSFTFGADVVSKFLNRHDLDLICRAHQVLSSHTTRVVENLVLIHVCGQSYQASWKHPHSLMLSDCDECFA